MWYEGGCIRWAKHITVKMIIMDTKNPQHDVENDAAEGNMRFPRESRVTAPSTRPCGRASRAFELVGGSSANWRNADRREWFVRHCSSWVTGARSGREARVCPNGTARIRGWFVFAKSAQSETSFEIPNEQTMQRMGEATYRRHGAQVCGMAQFFPSPTNTLRSFVNCRPYAGLAVSLRAWRLGKGGGG